MTTNVPKLRPEVKQRWLEALRSGEYEQAQDVLRAGLPDDSGAYCCLGVLCDLAAKDGVVRVTNNDDGSTFYGGRDTMPPPVVVEWAFGDDYDAEVWSVIDDRYPGDGGTPRHVPLASLNDDYGFSFDQIADRIEADL